jgi:hypothetical protein
MFIVRIHDWNTNQFSYVGAFVEAERASLWIESQRRNDNEDIDYEICPLESIYFN